MEKIKHITYFLIILAGLFFLFGPEFLPKNSQFRELLNSSKQNEVIVVFNSGGWGNTPLEEAKDFKPIIEGIQNSLSKIGYSSAVIPYKRTENNFLGAISGMKSFFRSFKDQSDDFSQEIDNFAKENPNRKIIIAGLSNGATFTDETIKKLSQDAKAQVYAIEIGVPFWENTSYSDNSLILNSEQRDPLFKGEAKTLFSTLFEAFLKWSLAKVSNDNLAFSQAFFMEGHQYSWANVGPQINFFLEEKLRQN